MVIYTTTFLNSPVEVHEMSSGLSATAKVNIYKTMILPIITYRRLDLLVRRRYLPEEARSVPKESPPLGIWRQAFLRQPP
jgi:hypothetical protein